MAPVSALNSTLRYLAPAKVNLSLRVLGRRTDGYHLLRSVMTFFPLYDTLTITVTDTPEIRVQCTPDVTTNMEDNLVFRAARALQGQNNVRQGALIQLHKQIPTGAGLGGGSSDAATTLLALNQLWQLECSQDTLCDLGVTLGADIPFFVRGRAALVEGIGERITPLPQLPLFPLVLIHPGITLATKQVFAAMGLPVPSVTAWVREELREPVQEQLTIDTNPSSMRFGFAGDGGEMACPFHNDMAPSAMRLAPVIGDLVRVLERAGAQQVVMSGSGSTVAGLFPDIHAAQRVARSLEHASGHAGWSVFSGVTFNASQLASSAPGFRR
jgi:4-diphosphocytidyl-2-C-methyl-D-erythritol kinase